MDTVSAPRFQELSPDILRRIETVSNRMPRLYSYPIAAVRHFFWQRLRVIYGNIVRTVPRRDVCIDFGCGTGVFLPSLSKLFRQVQAIDIEATEAQCILDVCQLRNVALINADIYKLDEGTKVEPADAIVAADVLEHFRDLEVPARRLREWLKDDGCLFTSGPSENIFTRGCRKIAGWQKPWDHYHTGYEVEEFLGRHGFVRLSGRHVYRLMPMYIVSIWKKDGGAAGT